MDKIRLHVVTDKAFVWTVEEARKLREEHHITGILLGTLPQLSQQNVFLGLPLQLLPEEIIDGPTELAYLVDDAKAHKEATPQQALDFESARQQDISQQQAGNQKRIEEKRQAMAQVHADKIAQRRAQKAEQRKSKPQDSLLPDDPPPAPKPQEISHAIKIRGASDGLPWYQPEAHSYHSLEEAAQAGLWPYPRTSFAQAKCAVFEALWKRGYFMGSGLRFGGDFLVYPDDPLRYHSHFSTTVIPSMDKPIRPIDIVAMGRLATAVKKAHLLCGHDADKDEVQFFSLEWAAIG